MFHKSYQVTFDNITENTLIFSSENDYTLFKTSHRDNIIFIADKFLYRENIVSAILRNFNEQDWFRYNKVTNSRIYKRIDSKLFNKSMSNLHPKLYLDILADENVSAFHKYLYTMVQASLNLYKYAGLIKQGSLSIDKSRIQYVLKFINYHKYSEKEFSTIIDNFCKTGFVKRFNTDKIELIPSSELYEGTTIYHALTLHKNKRFTVNDFKKLAIELLFSAPTFEDQKNAIQYTTTLKRIGKALDLKPCTINYHTRGYLKMVKYQFITKEEHLYLKNKRIEDPSFPYSFIVYTNQKALWYNEDGEFQKNDEYYLTPVGSKLFTNKKFNSFHRTGSEVFDSINYLEFKSQLTDKRTFVHLTKEFNLVSFMDSVERKKNSPEYTSNDSKDSSNAYEIDLTKQIQIVYKNFTSVKASLQQLVAILGMIKNFSSCDINICQFNWNQKFYRLDGLIRYFAKAIMETNAIDEDTLKQNLRTFRYIIDRTRALQNSRRHIFKFMNNQRDKEITNQRYNDRIKYQWTPEASSKSLTELFSFLFKNQDSANESVGIGLSA